MSQLHKIKGKTNPSPLITNSNSVLTLSASLTFGKIIDFELQCLAHSVKFKTRLFQNIYQKLIWGMPYTNFLIDIATFSCVVNMKISKQKFFYCRKYYLILYSRHSPEAFFLVLIRWNSFEEVYSLYKIFVICFMLHI